MWGHKKVYAQLSNPYSFKIRTQQGTEKQKL